jgi:hypothetical protein
MRVYYLEKVAWVDNPEPETHERIVRDAVALALPDPPKSIDLGGDIEYVLDGLGTLESGEKYADYTCRGLPGSPILDDLGLFD